MHLIPQIRRAGTITLKPYGEEDLPILWTAARESVARAERWLPWCRPVPT